MNRNKTVVTALKDIALVRVHVSLTAEGFHWTVREYVGTLKKKRYEVQRIETDMTVDRSVSYVALEKLMHVDYNIVPSNQQHAYYMWCLPTEVSAAREKLLARILDRVNWEYQELSLLKQHCDKLSQ